MWGGGFDISKFGESLGASLSEGLSKAQEGLGEVVAKAKAEAERLESALHLDGDSKEGVGDLIGPDGSVLPGRAGRLGRKGRHASLRAAADRPAPPATLPQAARRAQRRRSRWAARDARGGHRGGGPTPQRAPIGRPPVHARGRRPEPLPPPATPRRRPSPRRTRQPQPRRPPAARGGPSSAPSRKSSRPPRPPRGRRRSQSRLASSSSSRRRPGSPALARAPRPPQQHRRPHPGKRWSKRRL
jgi:hypothetical protein